MVGASSEADRVTLVSAIGKGGSGCVYKGVFACMQMLHGACEGTLLNGLCC